jgi:hypothetical protein
MGIKGPDFFFSSSNAFSNKKKASSQEGSSNVTNLESEKIVDKHLKDTNLSIQMKKELAEVQLKSQAIRPGQNVFKNKGESYLDRVPLPIEAKDRFQKESEQLFQKPNVGKWLTPSEQIINQLAEDQIRRQEEALARQEYILEFRRNAWYGGYDVRVNEKGEVTSVRPLSPSQRKMPFPDDQH